ncbi:AAA family ATPase [Streptomyces sp. HNM0663]|uniref:AAA family ATPase n=1 Tax=Streptomyces chengmaiensis TaxID=3040919 RepID=A0ABT6HJ05_9ACTN|nr:AAA family ATPase [Streptomyces chengmaiensis]MDH2388300.1 AAA family ATPase [Streptomyces chengmaiensis]
MTLRSITVTKLFGELDHYIPLRVAEGLTLLHGPNGVGKTSILKAVDALFNQQFSKLRSMPIEKLGVEFSEGGLIEVSWQTPKPDRGPQSLSTAKNLVFHYHPHHGRGVRWVYEGISRREIDFPLAAIDDFVPHLSRIGRSEWLDAHTNRSLDLDDVLHTYGQMIPFGRRKGKPTPDWLRRLLSDNPVYLIEAQRLVSTGDPSGRVSRPKAEQMQVATVSLYKRDLAAKIRNTLADYADYSQSLDSTFPNRLLSRSSPSGPRDQEVRDRYTQQAERRKKYVEIGLLDAGDVLLLPENLDDHALGVLGVYLDDIDDKLTRLDDLAGRLELFLDIVNQKLRRVYVEVDRENGLVAKTRKEEAEIALESLSSGEQQEIVIAYGLLFREQAGTLVLVDEPELSLHVSWQLDFIPDLLRIAQLARLNFIAATHSPQIINDRWDLTVALSDGA